MGGTTPAPWSIPYPVGTDRVADGDNAMQAIAERVAAICNLLPRGLVQTHYAAGSWTIGDSVIVTLPAYACTESRDVLVTIDFMWAGGANGSGFYGYLRDNGADVLRFDYSEGSIGLKKLTFALRLQAIVPGSHAYSIRLSGWASNAGVVSNPTLAIWDMGATGAI